MKETVFRELYKNATIDNLTEEEMKTYQKSVMEYDDVILSMNYVKSKSFEIGEKRGLEKGRESEQIKFVRNCYKHNLSLDEIAELTGLEVEQVSAILHA